ncbi:hypothetical protein AKO1_005790 [Acrasis kona]|uniref:Uncharacterized protein n=1 Tax=Acrasis kona TaxID=1008807 RepID=A0AAW2YK72_9EUKA
MNEDGIFEFFDESMLSSCENQDFTAFLNPSAIEDMVPSNLEDFEVDPELLNVPEQNTFEQVKVQPEDIVPEACTSELPTEPEQAPEDDSNQPSWTIHNVRSDVYGPYVQIKVRTRDEDEEWNQIPECMYSSIRYIMSISIDANILPRFNAPLIMCKVGVVDEAGTEIKKSNGENVLKGPKEIQNLELNRTTNALECDIPIKWTSVSFHHSKRKFAFDLTFFDFAEGTTTLLFGARSKSFHTFARRPKVSERPQKEKVNKRPTVTPSTINTAVCKKRKMTKVIVGETKSESFMKFASLLERLIAMKSSLNEEEREFAEQLVQEKLGAIKLQENETTL